MADNVLANLFQDIAGAIREKNGETDTMKPIEFPDKIRAIETGGGGGGSIPAAVYLSAAPFHGLTVQWEPFSLNGEVYLTSSNVAGAGYLNRIDKWNGTKWETLLSSSENNAFGTTMDSATTRVEYHGKVHFFGSNKHATFDGTTLTTLNATPAKTTEGVKAVVYQDKIVAYFAYNGGLYEWDEATDTWTLIWQTSSYSYYYLFAIDNELYAVKSGDCYRWTGGTMVKVNASNITQGSYLSYGFAHNGCIYYVYGLTTYAIMYKYNPVTDECSVVDDYPQFASHKFMLVSGELYCMGTTNTSYSSHNPCFKVNIVEGE